MSKHTLERSTNIFAEFCRECTLPIKGDPIDGRCQKCIDEWDAHCDQQREEAAAELYGRYEMNLKTGRAELVEDDREAEGK